MRLGTIFILAIASAIPAILLGPGNSAELTPDAERQAVRDVLDAQKKAWNKGDLEAYMTGYWKSDALTFFSGTTQTRGWQATFDRYRKRYQADGKEMGKLVFRDISVELLAKDAAWVRGRWELTQAKDKHGGLFTLLVKKQPEGWRIVHDHTSGE